MVVKQIFTYRSKFRRPSESHAICIAIRSSDLMAARSVGDATLMALGAVLNSILLSAAATDQQILAIAPSITGFLVVSATVMASI